MDPHRITSEAELEAILGEPQQATALKLFDHLVPQARAYLERSPFVLVATADAEGRQDVSPKGDHPGFVEAPDERTLLLPERPGNKLAYGFRNLLQNPRIGLIFLLPGTPETLRVNGRAELTRDPEVCERLSARGRPALLATRVHVEECFFHCAKAFVRASLWKPESWPERQRVSFGAMMKQRLGVDDATVQAIDEAIAQDARENL